MTTLVDGFTMASEMPAVLRARTISAVKLLDLHLARIGRRNPRLNAIGRRDRRRVVPGHDPLPVDLGDVRLSSNSNQSGLCLPTIPIMLSGRKQQFNRLPRDSP
jgi:Asp-tRNA(Asn)/Glu-tRNA(Gln) amidotransferase A subunit family amidase